MNWFKYPLVIEFVSAYFVWFSIPAWCVIAGRAVSRRMSRREIALLLTFLGCVAFEIFQIKGLDVVKTEMIRSLTRYFGAFGPFLWIWTAWLLHKLWTLRHRVPRIVCRLLVVGFCLYVLVIENVSFFVRQHEHGPAFDAYVAGALVAETIMNDWNGPPRRSCMMYKVSEYLTAELPAVFDTWGTAAWWVRGQSEGPCLGNYRYPPDYLLINDYEGYRGDQSKYRPEDYRALRQIESTAHRWMLLKRVAK